MPKGTSLQTNWGLVGGTNMASVNELLLAAQAKKSPVLSGLEGLAQGYIQGQNQQLDRMKTLIALKQNQEDRRKQEEAQANLRKQLNARQDSAYMQQMNAAGPTPQPVRPQDMVAKFSEDASGNLSATYTDPKETDTAMNGAKLDLLNARVEALRNNSGRADRKFSFSVANDLRKEFINRPEVKDYVTVATNVKSMDSLLKQALEGGDKNNLVAIDQGLVTMYNKLTDPNSVVRESEYARTPQNLPVVNRILGAISKIQQGGAGLTNEDRAALVLGAKIIANERGGSFQERRDSYTNQALDAGIDPFRVTGTIPPFERFNVGSELTTPSTTQSDTNQPKKPVGRWNPQTQKVEFF